MTATTLYVRDVPGEVQEVLAHRASARGLSISRYAVEVLRRHCALPTVEEWLCEVTALPTATPVDSAAAVSAAREDGDRELALAGGRR